MGLDIAAFFREFVHEVRSSPLYMVMSPLLAENPTVVTLYDDVPPTQRRPNLLLAAIHYSILCDPSDELAEWYPTVGGSRSPSDGGLGPAIDALLHSRFAELQALVTTGATQTNEVGRSAVVLPALSSIHDHEEKSLGLVEVGTSGGLNLRLDSFAITYRRASEPDVRIGPEDSSVHISCDTSRSLEPIPVEAMRALRIGSRIGSDLNPLDVNDDLQVRWLQALIWPDEVGRFNRLSSALALARTVPVTVVQADAVEIAAEHLLAVPSDQHPVLLTTWMLTYLPEPRRRSLVENLEAVARRRPFSWVCMEHPHYLSGIPWSDDVVKGWNLSETARPADAHVLGTPVVVHRFTVDAKGDVDRNSQWVATTHPHGTWLNWHPTSSARLLG